MLPSEVERKLLTVLRPYGKVKKGFLKKSAAEFFFSDHWSFNKNITHTCSPEISFAAKRLSMGTVFHFFDFLFVRCIDYLSGCILRQQFWKKMNLFWDTLDSKIHDSKKVVQPKKKNDINLEWFYHYNILQPWILTILEPFSPLPRHCQRSVPKSSVVLSQASKTSVQSQRGSTRNLDSLQIAEVRCWKLWAPQVGSEKGIELYKGKSAKLYYPTKRWYICYTSPLFNAFLGIFTCWIMLN